MVWGISWTGVQTGLILLTPWILPRIIPCYNYVHDRITGVSPPPISTPPTGSIPNSAELPTAAPNGFLLQPYRLVLYLILASFTLRHTLSPPFNVFLNLAPYHNTLSKHYPALRNPLEMRTPTDLLSMLWTEERWSPRSAQDEKLLLSLTSWDARLIYATYGASALVDCDWCVSRKKKPSSAGIELDDHLLYLIPFIAVQYLIVLVGSAFLVEGKGRGKWRGLMMMGWIAGALTEAYLRATWIPSSKASLDVIMVDTYIIIVRNAFFFVLVTVLYFLPAPTPLLSNSIPRMLMPLLVPILRSTDTTLQRMRIYNFERTTMMKHKEYRDKSTEWWERAEQETLLVNAAPEAIALKSKLGLVLEEGDAEAVALALQNATTPPPNTTTTTTTGKEGEGDQPSVAAGILQWFSVFLVQPSSQSQGLKVI